MLTVYVILPIFIGWFTNYIFGAIAVCFRKKSGSVNCFYWVFYIFVDLGLFVISVYCLYGLEYVFDMYLLFGVGITFY